MCHRSDFQALQVMMCIKGGVLTLEYESSNLGHTKRILFFGPLIPLQPVTLDFFDNTKGFVKCQLKNIMHFHFRYIFLEYSNPHEANEAVKATNGYKLDKSHTFIVNLFSDFDKYANVPDEWEPPTPAPYKDPVRQSKFHCVQIISHT